MRIALFDFDGTLTRRDSLLPFLRYVRGTGNLALDLAAVAPDLARWKLGLATNEEAKTALLRKSLAGVSAAEFEAVGEDFAATHLDALLNPALHRRLLDHQAEGDVCVLVSASLEAYLRPWCVRHGFAACLASVLEVRDGRLTGHLLEGNCWGEEKARRAKKWISSTYPHHRPTLIAYGDSRGDRQLLEMADAAFLRGRRVK